MNLNDWMRNKMCQIKKIIAVKITKITTFVLSCFLNWEHFHIHVQGTLSLAFPRWKKGSHLSQKIPYSLSNTLNCVCQTTSAGPTKSSLSWLRGILKQSIQIAIVQMKEGNFQEENLDSPVFLHIQFPHIQSLFLKCILHYTSGQRFLAYCSYSGYCATFPVFTPSCPAWQPGQIETGSVSAFLTLTSFMLTHLSYSTCSLYYFCGHIIVLPSIPCLCNNIMNSLRARIGFSTNLDLLLLPLHTVTP